MSDLNEYAIDIEPPTLYETLQVARDNGVVGEARTVLTLVLSMVRGQLIVMTGPSRAGKDECVDAAEAVVNSDQTVYRWPADDSETDAYYRRHEINRYPVHRFPDLARLETHHEKILKAFGEGRDATRSRTDITGEEGDQNEEQILECPQTVIAFIATDNEQIDLDDYPELRNRALTLSVDASEEQTHRVNRRKAEEHAGRTEQRIGAMRKAEIQEYHESIPVDEWDNVATNEIINPAAINIHEQQPIPELFPEARQDFDRLLEFMETTTLYHYPERLVVEESGKRKMFVSPVDIWAAMTVIGNKMVMSALNLTREDRAILDLLKESSEELTKADIQQALRSQGYHITDKDVRRSIDTMRTKGYVRVFDDTSPHTYTFNEFGSVVYHDAGIDYTEVVDAASEAIYDVAPDSAADTYVEEFCSGTGLLTTHPFTGEAVDILENDDLDEMMDTGVRAVEDIFDESESGEKADSSETQATL